MKNVSARIGEVEKLLKEIREDVDVNGDTVIVGVQFPVERIGRLSTKVLFFKGSEDMKLGDKVVISAPCPFIRRNYGDNPVGIVTMNGNYAKLTAQAENFRVIDTAIPYSEQENDIDVLDYGEEDEVPVPDTIDDDDDFSVCGITNMR